MKKMKNIDDGDLLLDEDEELDRDIDEGGRVTIFCRWRGRRNKRRKVDLIIKRMEKMYRRGNIIIIRSCTVPLRR